MIYHYVGNIILNIYNDYRSLVYLFSAAFITIVYSKYLQVEENPRPFWGILLKSELWILNLIIGVVLSIQSLRLEVATSGLMAAKVLCKDMFIVMSVATLVCLLMMIIIRKLNIEVAAVSFGIMVVCVFQMIRGNRFAIEGWGAAWYAMDYSMGLGSRMFIGTILKLFYDDFLTSSLANHFVLFSLWFLAALISLMLAVCINKVDENRRPAVIFFVLLFFSCPGSFQSIAENFGRFEMFGFIVILFMVLWNHFFQKQMMIRYIGINIFSITLVLIHQGNLFLLFTVLFMILLLNEYRGGYWRKKEVCGSMVTIVVTSITFLVMQFVGTRFTYNEEALREYLSSRTELGISGAIHFEYFSSIIETYNTINKKFLRHTVGYELPWIKAAVTIVILLPLIVCFVLIWKQQWKKLQIETKQFYRNPMTYLLLSFLCILPEFFLNVDWGRWFAAICFVQFTLLFIMIYYEYGAMNEILKMVSQLVVKYKIIAVLFLIYLAMLDKFQGRSFLEEVDIIVNSLSGI